MSNPWFRMYSEFSHDPKVQMMSESMQRRYVMLMCLRCSNDLVTLRETEVAFHLRISNDEMAETRALFIAKGFIDSDWNLLNWEKRQFASDTSNARVAKHRALQKEKQSKSLNDAVTLPKRYGNALDTDTDTDTDTDKRRECACAPPPDIPAGLLNDFLEVRKAKKAGPLTPTALNAIAREGAKAGLSLVQAVTYCCEVGWSSFNTKWHAERTADKTQAHQRAETPYQRSMRERMTEVSPELARPAPGQAPSINNITDFFQNATTLELKK
jgi:hypothetical protein